MNRVAIGVSCNTSTPILSPEGEILHLRDVRLWVLFSIRLARVFRIKPGCSCCGQVNNAKDDLSVIFGSLADIVTLVTLAP
jgi:hypothetical protein